jgi:signal transduction histidine kinase
MRGMTPTPRPDSQSYSAREAHRARALRAAHELLRGLEVQPARECDAGDTDLMRSLDTLFAQTIRASRHTSGSVRAYASLIEDGYDATSNAVSWAARITHAVGELDEFAARMASLRMCENERVTEMRWGDVLARVAARCGSLGLCTIEVVDRTTGSFRQRSEWIGRALFHALRNAIEATPRGGIVRVRADQVRIDGAPAVHIRITDAGGGIGAGIAPDTIWKPFITNKANHAGLGLAYVAACARGLSMVNGMRSDASGTTFHSIIFEEGELSW